MRLKYSDLKTRGYAELIKKGATKEQILNKLSNLYLSENRQLIINETKGLTISKALRELKRGKVSQGVYIHKTARVNTKRDISTLKLIEKAYGKDTYATSLLNQYRRGESNVYQIHEATSKIVSNPSEYLDGSLENEITSIIEGFNNV